MKDFLPCRQPVSTRYSADSNECLEACMTNGSTPTGRVSKDGKRLYVCCGSQVEVLDVDNGQRIASWSHGHRVSGGSGQQAAASTVAASEADTAVTHAAPRILCADAVDDHASRLLLGLDLPPAESGSRVHSHGGLLCLFDVPSCKVIRAVALPYPVTAVSMLTTHFAGCDRLVPVEQWKWSTLGGGQEPEGCLSYFAGAVAVGTEHGGIYLLDLCLDDDAAWSSSEIAPLTCRSLAPPPLTEDGGHAWLLDQRRSCRAQRAALAFQLAGPKRGRYSYMRPDDYVLKTLNSDEAAVTSVQFIPEMGALCVGFAFGSFQLWSLSPLALDYSSRFEEAVPPVVAFAHQLPEDDPRNFCYLWVVHCNGSQMVETSSGSGAPELVLHQLQYTGKSIDDQYGWTTFQELSTIAPRLEHRLQPDRDAHHGDDGCWFVACHTLPDVSRVPSNCYQHDSVDEEIRHHGYLQNSGLCLFSWCVLNYNDTTSKYDITCQFSIFDINRWYHAQMPQTVRPAPGDDVCPYFANYSLGDSHELNLSSLLDVAVDTTTISRYSFPVGIAGEQALWPSTLRLSAIFMFSTGTVSAVFLGLQGQVIHDIVRAGPAVLASPRTVHRQLVDARLAGAAATSNDDVVREEVLSILLQHGQVDFILCCVRELSSGGNDIGAGCDLKFLLRWAWSQAAKLKASFDAAAVCLFDCNGVPLDESTARQLSDCSRQLNLLSDIMHCLRDAQDTTGENVPITDTGYQELGVKVTVLSLITLYAKAVVWCHTVGMLPEDIRSPDDSSDEWLRMLRRTYDAERLELRQQVMLRSSWFTSDTSAAKEDEQDTLIIDGLVSQCGDALRALWSSSESDTSLPYPPTSVHSMVTMLLLKEGDPLLKTSIFFYFVLDFISIHSDCARNEQMVCSADVISTLSMPETRANLISGFWLLEHGRIEESVDKLSDPSVVTSMEPWQSRRVLTRLLSQGHHAAALRIVRLRQTFCASDDSAALVLVALLSNGCIREAFRLLREENSREADPAKVATLFNILLDEWQKKRRLGDVLSLPFSSSDEDFLMQYLTRHSRQDLVVMRKLQQASIDDALRLNRDARMPERSADAEVRARNATRAIIVDWYARTIPAIRQRVAGVSAHYPPRRRGPSELRRPVPLSAVAIRSGGGRRTAPAAPADEPPPSGSRDASRPFLADILDQICELHEHERLQQQRQSQAATADRSAAVGAAAMDRGQHESTADGVVAAAVAAADAAASISAAVRSSPSQPPRPFVETPMHLRSVARLVRPSPMAIKACKKDELVEKAAVSLKRPLSPSPLRLKSADPPSAKSLRLSTAVAPTVGEQAWALLQTPLANRHSPLSRTRPGVGDTPVVKFASLPTPQSILKTRVPTADAAQQQRREAIASTSGDDALSSASVLTSTAKKGVSFVGLSGAASPNVLLPADDVSPIAEAASMPHVDEMRNRRQTAIMPASGLKPLKEFGLPLPTPPRYDRASTTKVPEPATAGAASRLMNNNEDVRPICIRFDEDEEDSDSEEMLSAEDTSFPSRTSSISMEETQAEQVHVEQAPREEAFALPGGSSAAASAAVGSSRTLAIGVQQIIVSSSSTAAGAASELLNRCETGAESTTAPCSFESRSFDDATSAAASAALLESSDSAVTLSEGQTGNDGQQKQSSIAVEDEVAYTDAATPGKEQDSAEVSVPAGLPVHPSDEPRAENAEKLVEPTGCRTPPAAGLQLSHDDRTESRPGDSVSAVECGWPGHSLDAFAMSSGLALRSQIEWTARLEAAYVHESHPAVAQSCDATGSATSAVAAFVYSEQAAAFASASETEQAQDATDIPSQQTPLEPSVEPNLIDGNTSRSSDDRTVSPTAEEHPTQSSVPADDRTNSDMSLLTAAAQPLLPVTGGDECGAQIVAPAATPMEEEEEEEKKETFATAAAAAATAGAGGSRVSTDAGPELRHRKSVIRPFTFVPPTASASGGNDEPPPSRSSARRQANRRLTVAVVGPAGSRSSMGGPSATGSGDQGLADHSAASGASRRSLRPRSSFKQDMVSAVGELLEPESKVAGAAALPPRETRWSSRRVSASSSGSGVGVPPASGVAAETAEAAAESVATSGSKSTRSKARSRQESGDSTTSGGGRTTAAPSVVTVTSATAAGQRSLLPTLAEASPADPDDDDGSSGASQGRDQLALASTTGRRGRGGSRGGSVSARKATRHVLRDKQPSTAISFSAGGDDGDVTSALAAAAPPPPSPFRDGRRRLRGTQVPPESTEAAGGNAALHEAAAGSVSSKAATWATETYATPLLPPVTFAETQSQRSTRSRQVKADPVSNTPINFTPASSRASARRAASSAARGIAAASLRSHEELSASPLKMTLRNRQSKKS